MLYRSRFLRWLLGAMLVGVGAFTWATRPLWMEPDGARLASLPAPHLVEHQPGRATVLFLGDTHFGESYSAAGSQADPLAGHGYDFPLSFVQALTKSADLGIANLETPLTVRHGSPLRLVKRWVHWGNPEPTAQALASLGIRAVSLANNHAFDSLQGGLMDTLSVLSQHGIAGFGAGSDLINAARPFRADFRFAQAELGMVVLGTLERRWSDWAQGAYATYTGSGTFALTPATVASEIRALRKQSPSLFVVVFPHWGDNYAWRSDEQSFIGHELSPQ
jgi:poly-gamma-glutamate capsule biosynthesis protein CapA/YwtB (metallophosphatase superfamily)